jgi:biopolymer transport protein TolQ
MNTDLSIIKLISEASLVVQIVIALLVFASFLSWALILVKSGKLRQARRATEKFDEQFWSGISLNTLYDELGEKNQRQALERIFYDGFHEYKRIYSAEANVPFPVVDAVGRTMRVAVAREVSQLEQNITFLATVGSTAPYIGLFGTVWGIMNSFISIGAMKQATLAVVAPGIAEALFATAMGLVAAIPAVVAYNKITNEMGRYANRIDTFSDEFGTILSRQLDEEHS